MYDYFLFDLDGTLTDPGLGITNSVAYALEKYHISVKDRRELYPFIGPPLWRSFSEFYGFDEKQTRQAIVYYREYFGEKGLFENEVYAGIPDVLAALKQAGKTLLVATSKPEIYTNRILEHFDLARYFDVVAGATMDETRNEKADIIAYALKQIADADPSKIVMIGDRKFDILGARENGIDSIGVLYGYGSRAELEEAQATYIAEEPEDVLIPALELAE